MNLNNILLQRKTTHNIIVFNIILWVCSFIILLFIFSGKSSPLKVDYIYTSYFVLTLIIPVLINLYLLIPKYLKREKYLIFSLLFLINLIVFAEINRLFFDFIVSVFLDEYYFISYNNKIEVYFIFFIFFLLSSLIKLGEDWVSFNKQENEALKIQNQEIENQLYYLKGQINPHFLFNSLNVLYSLAIDKKEEITDAILQLSNILRYIIYDIEVEKVNLEKEISLIKNYIDFEKNRHIENSKVNFEFNISGTHEIYPMLLLPIVENSFKHGLKSGVENPFVTIKLTEEKGYFFFEISNNFKKRDEEIYSGVGLKNIEKNLGLIYPKKHTFIKEIKENIFIVNLKIDLNL